MIRFIEGQDNLIEMSVASSIDTTGFTVQVTFCGGTKTISGIKDGETYPISFSSGEVATIPDGLYYGVVEIISSDNKTYQKNCVRVEKVKSVAVAMDYQKLPLVLSASWVGKDSGGGGGGGDYVTHQELQASSESDRAYTDEKVTGVIVEALEQHQVVIHDKDGHEISLTVKESMQQTEDLRSAVEELSDTRLQGGTKEEFNDTIYLYTHEMPRKRRKLQNGE